MLRSGHAILLALIVMTLAVACGTDDGQEAAGGFAPMPETPTVASNAPQIEPTEATIPETPTKSATESPPQDTSSPPKATKTGGKSVNDPEQNRAVEAARRVLAQTAIIDAEDAVVVSITAQEWPDSALGCPEQSQEVSQ